MCTKLCRFWMLFKQGLWNFCLIVTSVKLCTSVLGLVIFAHLKLAGEEEKFFLFSCLEYKLLESAALFLTMFSRKLDVKTCIPDLIRHDCFLWSIFCRADLKMPPSLFSAHSGHCLLGKNWIHRCWLCVQYMLGRTQPMSLTSPTSRRHTRSPALPPTPTALTTP